MGISEQKIKNLWFNPQTKIPVSILGRLARPKPEGRRRNFYT